MGQPAALIKSAWARASLFALASSAAVCFPFVLGFWLWPEGLTARAEHIFWPATGVNVAGLLLLGWRYFPVIWSGVLAAVIFLGQPALISLIAATGNVLEALLAYWIVRKFGKFTGYFDNTRPVIALLAASLIAPVISSLSVPAYLIYDGTFSAKEFWVAVGNWNLANGAAMLILTPLIVSLAQGRWNFRGHVYEAIFWLGTLAIGAALTFHAVFDAHGFNFAFLVFPLVIMVAVRFGPAETAVALGVVMASIYLQLSRNAPVLLIDQAPAIIWFVQAFSWVLAATGLIVAALVSERRLAETLLASETARSHDISLREERARLDALRYQINPHFLFNALNSVRATLPLPAQASREIVTALAGYLRSTLARPEADLTQMRDEIESVEHYLAIEQKRFGQDLITEISVTPDAEEVWIPIFLLQPLVENAIRHGFTQSKGVLKLQIHARLEREQLVIEVANTGKLIEYERRDRPGLGLENIRSRLQLLYGERAALTLTVEDGWVRGQIRLPHAAEPSVSIP